MLNLTWDRQVLSKLFSITQKLSLVLILLSLYMITQSQTNLTGLWQDDDGVQYSVREVDGKLFWLADNRPSFIQVFQGSIYGTYINGAWADVPGGNLRHHGSLDLKVEDANKMVITNSYGDPFMAKALFKKGSAESTGSDLGDKDESIVGSWKWFNGIMVTFTGNGRISTGSYTGSWAMRNQHNRQYTLTWDHGYKDIVVLSNDGKRLDGTSNTGAKVWGIRSGYVQSGNNTNVLQGAQGNNTGQGISVADIVGTWKWFNGATVIMDNNGNVSTKYTSGLYSLLDPVRREFLITWNNGYVDRMILSDNKQKLDGKNTTGARVWATRINYDGEIDSPEQGTLASGGMHIKGTWKWFNGHKVNMDEYGNIWAGNYTGKWKQKNAVLREYIIKWDHGYTDVMRLSADGKRLDGKSNTGATVWGERISYTPEPRSGAQAGTRADGASDLCDNPRTQILMDEWLNRAIPPHKPGENVSYDPWGRVYGTFLTTIVYKPTQKPDTQLDRCNWLLHYWTELTSTNIGTLKDYVLNRLVQN